MMSYTYYVSYLSWKPGSWLLSSDLIRVDVMLLVNPPMRYVPMPLYGVQEE